MAQESELQDEPPSHSAKMFWNFAEKLQFSKPTRGYFDWMIRQGIGQKATGAITPRLLLESFVAWSKNTNFSISLYISNNFRYDTEYISSAIKHLEPSELSPSIKGFPTLTVEAQDILVAAQSISLLLKQPEIEPHHIFAAILANAANDDNPIAKFGLKADQVASLCVSFLKFVKDAGYGEAWDSWDTVFVNITSPAKDSENQGDASNAIKSDPGKPATDDLNQSGLPETPKSDRKARSGQPKHPSPSDSPRKRVDRLDLLELYWKEHPRHADLDSEANDPSDEELAALADKLGLDYTWNEFENAFRSYNLNEIQPRRLNQQETTQVTKFFKQLECKISDAVNNAVNFTLEDAAAYGDVKGQAILCVGNLYLGFIQSSFVERGTEHEELSLSVALADQLSIGDSWLQSTKRQYWALQKHIQRPSNQTGFAWGQTFSKVWQTALGIKIKCSPNKDEQWIAARHLLASMIKLFCNDHEASIELQSVGFNALSVARVLWNHIKLYVQKDDNQAWLAYFEELPASLRQEIIFPSITGTNLDSQSTLKQSKPGSRYIAGPVGYNSEFCRIGLNAEVQDRLNVSVFAERLAELISLRETRMPLAIGLFGNWGSGKSHFMNLMDQHMIRLASETNPDWERQSKVKGADLRPDQANQGPWCQQVVTIHFNAWHYVDTNLWASLISQIFESLFNHLKPKQDELEKVQELLEQASGATARASEGLAIAISETSKAQTELNEAKQAREKEETVIQGLVQGLDKLLPNGGKNEVQAQVAAMFGVDKELATLNELEREVAQAKLDAGRAKRLWNSFWGTRGWGWRLGWIAALAGSIFFGPSLCRMWGPLKLGHDFFVRAIAAIMPFMVCFGVAVKAMRKSLAVLEQWAAKARDAQVLAQKTPKFLEAEKNVVAVGAREQEARRRLAEAQAKQKQLEIEARNLSPERRISRFIEQRAQSSDYRGQLGLVSLARRDFEELSNLFANKAALHERLKQLRSENKTEEAEKIDDLSYSIDRIVLFVDDLDRCQNEKVVDVLQAVHLLLAFPLFSVVVGVDQRCLRQSLSTEFKGLLSPILEKDSTDRHAASNQTADGRVTPLDYLEKIFHVPFHLPSMDATGFEDLIENLTEPSIFTPVVTKPGLTVAMSINQGTAQLTTPNSAVTATTETQALAGIPPNAPLVTLATTGQYLPGVADMESSQLTDVIGSVPLERWERDALKKFHPLIKTPRGTTRFLNTYRLVRAGVPRDEWALFCGNEKDSGEYLIAMLLLAASAGCPAFARDWFKILRSSDKKLAPKLNATAGSQTKEWDIFKELYDENRAGLNSTLTPDRLKIWLSRVERFTF